VTEVEKPENEQLPLFEEEKALRPSLPSPLLPDLTPQSTLASAQLAFERYMGARNFTANTHQAFRLDMDLLAEYLSPQITLGEITTANLNAYLTWMTNAREVPCSPKTMERRITTLKVFFGWMLEAGVLIQDPAAPLIHHSVAAPVPDPLTEDQIHALLAETHSQRMGDPQHKPDARPHLLLTLVLYTGIKKSETVGLALNHIDRSNPDAPAIWIRYAAERRHKERRLALPPWWLEILDEYLEQYQPVQTLFPWTARNLEYVLTGVAQNAGVPRVTFEILRWTCAIRDYLEGMERTELRQKLGLSEISWYEVEPRLALSSQRLQARSHPPEKPAG